MKFDSQKWAKVALLVNGIFVILPFILFCLISLSFYLTSGENPFDPLAAYSDYDNSAFYSLRIGSSILTNNFNIICFAQCLWGAFMVWQFIQGEAKANKENLIIAGLLLLPFLGDGIRSLIYSSTNIITTIFTDAYGIYSLTSIFTWSLSYLPYLAQLLALFLIIRSAKKEQVAEGTEA